ncbi:tetratricopeptide repeat protein [Acidisphaera sp. S103]|uniref:tetratricopeptide repeat protein n=1 Tax=Acidisphaera sp. S103 TaxID=1747223 RepID=UPI00131BEA19|nr:tetratricopeptide repeat protein [Acidisphaera sp. S103]
MQHARAARRSALLALILLSACAASEPPSNNATGSISNGVIGNYLAGRYALSEGDSQTAADDMLKALAENPGDQELTLQAFVASLDAGRPEAVKLARQLPQSQVAQLVLADVDIKAGHWQAAEQRLHDMPHEGLTQLLQPLLIAWAQQGDGATDAALSTLRPYVEDPRFRTIFALHAAMIADLGGHADAAARLYRATEVNLSAPNLRMSQILASWASRTKQPGEAQRILAALPTVAPDLSIVMPALMATVTERPVANATDGIAEAYFTFASLLQAQDANDFSLVMLRLALDMRPDFAAARLLAADILDNQHHPQMALNMLNQVPATDPLSAAVRLRRVAVMDRLGHADQATHELERMAQDYPDSPLPDEQRGDLLRLKSRFPDAVQAYDRAIARVSHQNAADWILFYDRGVAEERAHAWPKAEADFHHALELSPDQPFVLNYLGYSWADMGRHLSEARQMIERAAQRRPNDGAITDSLGWVMFRQGDAKDAVTTLEHAVELEPEDSTINGHLGDAYWAAGRKIEAQYQWRRALTLNPDPDDAAKLEAKLNTGRSGAVLSGQ